MQYFADCNNLCTHHVSSNNTMQIQSETFTVSFPLEKRLHATQLKECRLKPSEHFTERQAENGGLTQYVRVCYLIRVQSFI